MRILQNILTVFLLVLCGYFKLSGQLVDRQFSKAELQTDFQIFRIKYESQLANLYLYSSKPELDHLLDSLYQNIKPMTELEFYNYITPLSALVKDGHSNIFPSEQTIQQHNQHSKFFPFNIYFTDDKMFVVKNFSNDSSIADGTEILEINGLSAKAIMAFLVSRQVRDGYNEGYAFWILNSYFREYYSYHFGHANNYSLNVKTTNGSEKKIVVDGLSKNTISLNRAVRYIQDKKNIREYLQIDTSTKAAIFTIKTWDNKKLNAEIDFVFSQLARNNVTNLILDLRDNQGGNFSPAIYLLSHLLNQPFAYFNEIKFVAGKSDTSQILKNTNEKIVRTYQPNKNPYTGNLYVLINGGSFSNTGSFCSRIEFYKRGVFIGEETGGNKVIFSGVFGLKLKTVLPHTKITCENANYRITVTDLKENTGHGVCPTYLIKPTISDKLQNKDVVLNAVFELLKK